MLLITTQIRIPQPYSKQICLLSRELSLWSLDSGSGKSTLGKLLSGLDHPSSGHVFIDDYELHTLDPSALRKILLLYLKIFD